MQIEMETWMTSGQGQGRGYVIASASIDLFFSTSLFSMIKYKAGKRTIINDR